MSESVEEWKKNPKADTFVVEKEEVHFEAEGVKIQGIVTMKSGWNFLVQATKTTCLDGLLIREGDFTLINPDKESPIAAWGIQVDARIHFLGNREDINWSQLGVVAFPRNTKLLTDEGKGEFLQLMNRNFKKASYQIDERHPCSYLSKGAYLPHNDFVEKEIGVRLENGLPVIKTQKRSLKEKALLEELQNAEIISKDPAIRKAFAKIFEGFVKGLGGEGMLLQGGQSKRLEQNQANSRTMPPSKGKIIDVTPTSPSRNGIGQED